MHLIGFRSSLWGEGGTPLRSLKDEVSGLVKLDCLESKSFAHSVLLNVCEHFVFGRDTMPCLFLIFINGGR